MKKFARFCLVVSAVLLMLCSCGDSSTVIDTTLDIPSAFQNTYTASGSINYLGESVTITSGTMVVTKNNILGQFDVTDVGTVNSDVASMIAQNKDSITVFTQASTDSSYEYIATVASGSSYTTTQCTFIQGVSTVTYTEKVTLDGATVCTSTLTLTPVYD